MKKQERQNVMIGDGRIIKIQKMKQDKHTTKEVMFLVEQKLLKYEKKK